MRKPENLPIDHIHVPVKRKKSLDAAVVQTLAESILQDGQQEPIVVRRDDDRFVLIEGFHRLEACRALGEPTILGVVVSAEEAHPRIAASDISEAERQKMERLKKLRLEREAAEKLAAASAGSRSASLQAQQRGDGAGRRETPSGRAGRGAAASAPRTLSEWIKHQDRTGGRY